MDPSTMQILGWLLTGGVVTAMVTHIMKYISEGSARRRAAEQELDRLKASREVWRTEAHTARNIALKHGVAPGELGPLPKDPYDRPA